MWNDDETLVDIYRIHGDSIEFQVIDPTTIMGLPFVVPHKNDSVRRVLQAVRDSLRSAQPSRLRATKESRDQRFLQREEKSAGRPNSVTCRPASSSFLATSIPSRARAL